MAFFLITIFLTFLLISENKFTGSNQFLLHHGKFDSGNLI
jgi:hypothetical protein